MSRYLLLACLIPLLACGGDPINGFDRSTDGTVAEPESEEEIMAALIATVLLPPMEDEGEEYASVLDMLIDAAIPSAHAAEGISEACGPQDEEDPDWVTMSLQGPSGVFGAQQNSFVANADTSYCQDSQGNPNDGEGLFRSFTLEGINAECNWGGTYEMSGVGIIRRVGNSYNKRSYATFSFDDGEEQGSGDCTVTLTGDPDTGRGLHAGGVCSDWTEDFFATPGTSCFIQHTEPQPH